MKYVRLSLCARIVQSSSSSRFPLVKYWHAYKSLIIVFNWMSQQITKFVRIQSNNERDNYNFFFV